MKLRRNFGFKGTWRNYQARVLEHADRYMADGKIHIVAAPGSGEKTTLIELIRQDEWKRLIFSSVHYASGSRKHRKD